MDYAKEFPEYGDELGTVMKDPRWPADDGLVKMRMDVNDVEIHYVYNRRSLDADDFKFKDRIDD